MNKKTVIALILLELVCTFHVAAQFSVNFNPAINGQSVEALAMTQFSNQSGAPLRVRVHIVVAEAQSGEVLDVRVPEFQSHPGANFIDKRAFSGSGFHFSSSSAGVMSRQSGKFPEGEYDFCFEIEIIDAKDPNVPPAFEQCFKTFIQPLSPLLLVNPIDEDEFCNKRPGFIWQPPVPAPAGTQFRVLLVEMRKGQDMAEAIATNQPLINQPGLSFNTLNFPNSIPDLKEGFSYAWQVTAYQGLTIIKKSEIWTFQVKCKDEKPVPQSTSYRELTAVDDGNFYVATNVLSFSIRNFYGGQHLRYSVAPLSEPGKAIKNLPPLELLPGLNNYDINLSENGDLIDGKEYLLKVFLPAQPVRTLRFIYRIQ